MAFGEGLHNAQASGGKRRTQLYALAGLGALVVVFLVIRSRSGASSGGYTSADLQNAAAQQAQADQQASGAGAFGTPSTFADNGASAGQLATDITAALGGEQTAIDNLTSAVQALQPAGSVPTTAASTDATPTPAPPPVDVTVNVTGGPGVHGSPARSQKAKNTGRKAAGGSRSTGKSTTVVKGNHGTSSHHAGGTKRHGHAKKKR